MIPHYFSDLLHAFSDSQKAPSNPESTVKNLNSRVNTLFSTCKDLVSTADQSKVNDLLGRMNKISTGDKVSPENLSKLNNSCLDLEVYIAQVLETVKTIPLLKFQLASLAVMEEPNNLHEILKEFNITNDEERLALTRVASGKKLNLEGNFQRASEAVLKNPGNIQGILKEFNITNDEERLALTRVASGLNFKNASEAVLKTPNKLMEIFKEFSITDGQQQVSLIKQAINLKKEEGSWSCFEFARDYLLPNFQSFNITNEADRISIAKSVAFGYESPYSIGPNIKNLNITDENERFEIAKQAASNKDIFKYLDNFDLNQEHRSEIITSLIDRLLNTDGNIDTEKLADLMKNLRANERTDILKKIITKKGVSYSDWRPIYILNQYFLPFIKEAPLNDRIFLAKAAAQNENRQIQNYIKEFDIPDENVRIELAKMIIPSPSFFEYFDIRNERAVIEIAKLSIKKYGSQFTGVKYLNLKDEKDRLELAKFHLECGCENIAEYDLSQENLALLAKVGASSKENCISVQIEDFGITDVDQLMEIARMTAMNEGKFLFQFLDKFCFGDQKKRNEIISLAASYRLNQSDPDDIKHLSHEELLLYLKIRISSGNKVNYLQGVTCAELTDIIIPAIKNSPQLSQFIMMETLFTCMKLKIGFSPQEHAKIVKAIALFNIDDEDENNPNIWPDNFSIFGCSFLRKSVDEMKDLMPFAEEILKYEDPNMRYAIMLLPLIHKIQPHADKNLRLYHMLLSPLFEGSGLSQIEQDQILGVLKQKSYKDSAKQGKIIRGLFSLWASSAFTPLEKGQLLKHIFKNSVEQTHQPQSQGPSKEKQKKGVTPHDSLQMLDAILTSKNADKLKRTEPQGKTEVDEKAVKAGAAINSRLKEPIDLQETIDLCFKGLLELESYPDFNEKYAATIGSDKTRNKFALLIYSAGLGSLPDKDRQSTLNSLKEFTTAVLEKRYSEWRYHERTGSHFDFVTKDRPQLRTEWQNGETRTLEELQANEKLKKEADVKSSAAPLQNFNPFEHLKAKIKNVPADQGNLIQFLKDGDRKAALEAANKIIMTKKLPQSAKYDSTNEETSKVFKAKLEVSIIKLLDPAIPAKNKIDEIDRILPNLINIYGDKEFAQGLKDIKKGLQEESQMKAKAEAAQKYIFVDTDNWEDMLVCGTEVYGSCQRIGGNVNLNKCLLGYMVDPKNRAIVVKDAKTGQIVARRIMRLLWDKDTNKPVLFQEALKKNPEVPDEVLKGIDLMFKHRANQLQLTLVCAEEEKKSTEAYLNNLHSFNSPSPFEYVDVSHINVTNGKYTVSAKDISLIQQA